MVIATAWRPSVVARHPIGGHITSIIVVIVIQILIAITAIVIATRFGRLSDVDDESERLCFVPRNPIVHSHVPQAVNPECHVFRRRRRLTGRDKIGKEGDRSGPGRFIEPEGDGGHVRDGPTVVVDEVAAGGPEEGFAEDGLT